MNLRASVFAIVIAALIGATCYAVARSLIDIARQKSFDSVARERARLDGMRTGILIEQCRTRCSSWEFEGLVLSEPEIDNLVGYVLPFGPDGADQCVCVLEGAEATP